MLRLCNTKNYQIKDFKVKKVGVTYSLSINLLRFNNYRSLINNKNKERKKQKKKKKKKKNPLHISISPQINDQ
jgi:hypothetical protein